MFVKMMVQAFPPAVCKMWFYIFFTKVKLIHNRETMPVSPFTCKFNTAKLSSYCWNLILRFTLEAAGQIIILCLPNITPTSQYIQTEFCFLKWLRVELTMATFLLHRYLILQIYYYYYCYFILWRTCYINTDPGYVKFVVYNLKILRSPCMYFWLTTPIHTWCIGKLTSIIHLHNKFHNTSCSSSWSVIKVRAKENFCITTTLLPYLIKNPF
jgi:hypothetical protein